MAGLLKGKTVVITGSASGIGRSTALAAASQGANLVLHHLGAPTAHQAEEVRSEVESRGAKAIVVEGDVADLETSELVSRVSTGADTKLVNAAVSAFGRVDAVVASAGICQFHPFLTLPRDLYLRTQDVNINGVFYLAQAAARQMVKQELVDGERGCFVGISSISAIMGGGEQCHYTPTKAAIRSLMESCAIAMGQHAIRFNSIMPGEYPSRDCLNRRRHPYSSQREAS